LAQKISPNPGVLEKQIKELQAKLGAKAAAQTPPR
jgi:hypothetical protein